MATGIERVAKLIEQVSVEIDADPTLIIQALKNNHLFGASFADSIQLELLNQIDLIGENNAS